MCARFTVLSDTPIAAAIAGCDIPLSRNNTIWMRWRCAAGIFQRRAVLSRRTSALLHLTIWSPESDGASESHLGQQKQPAVPPACLAKPLDPSRYGGGIRNWIRCFMRQLSVLAGALVKARSESRPGEKMPH